MGAMKRVALIGVLAFVAATVSAAPASASLCSNRILNQWEATGKIATTYPVSCYRQALAYAKSRPDIGLYSSLPNDIRAAMAAAIARQHGKKHVAPVVGKGFHRSNAQLVPTKNTNSTASSNPSVSKPTTTLAVGPTASTGGGSSIPVPLLVLGGLALLLAAAGVAGTIAKRRRG
jgi:hypothetical protein